MKKIIAIVCLVAILAVALVSCGPNFKSMQKKLEKEGYSVVYLDKKEVEEGNTDDLGTAEKLQYAIVSGLLNDTDVEGVLIAIKSEGLLDIKSVMVINFANKEDAEKVAEDVKDAQISGKVVYIGSDEAIDIVK